VTRGRVCEEKKDHVPGKEKRQEDRGKDESFDRGKRHTMDILKQGKKLFKGPGAARLDENKGKESQHREERTFRGSRKRKDKGGRRK